MTATATAPTRSRRAEAPPELERWRNSTAGRIVLEKFNAAGTLIDEMVGSYRMVHLTTQERRINEEKCATEEQNPFRNGILQPEAIPSGVPDAEALLANPNVLSEDAQRALFDLDPDPFAERLAQITQVAVLNRLLAMTGEVDARVSQYQAIQARLDEVAPLLATEIASAAVNADGGRPSRPVTPR